MNQESWCSVTPQYSQYDEIIERFSSLEHVDFLGIQPRLKQSLETFSALKGFTRALVINSIDNAFYRSLILRALEHTAPNKPVHVTESLSSQSLLGSYMCNENGEITAFNEGLLHKADGGYLIIPTNLILANPVSWQALKTVLLGQECSPVNANPQRIATQELNQAFNIKVIIVGDRDQISDLECIEPELYNGLALYTEVENEIALNDASIENYFGYLAWILSCYDLPELTPDAIHRVMVAGARYTEDQDYMPIEILWYLSLFQEACLHAHSGNLTAASIDTVVDNSESVNLTDAFSAGFNDHLAIRCLTVNQLGFHA